MQFNNPTRIRTFEILQYVTAPLDGEIQDWPANIQDAIYEALERMSQRVQLPLTIVASYCAIDYGESKEYDRPYLHIIASEIVVADASYMDEKARLERLIHEHVTSKTKH